MGGGWGCRWRCGRSLLGRRSRRQRFLTRGIRTECEHAQHDHFEAAARLGCQRQIAPPNQADLVVELHILRGHVLCQRQQPFLITAFIRGRLGNNLCCRHPLQQRNHVSEHVVEIRRLVG